jgi:hypothetical protein
VVFGRLAEHGFPAGRRKDPERNRHEANEGGSQHDLKRGRHISMMHLCDNDRKYGGRHRGLNHQHGFEGKVQRRNFRE